MSEKKSFDIDEDAFALDALSEAINSLKEVSPLVPAVFKLEKAIVNGLSDSYASEAERLKQKYGKTNARTREADDLAADLKNFQTETFSGMEFVKRSAQTFNEDNIFHGYVYDEDGEPAEGHTVVLLMKSERFDPKRLSSEVDSSGYFYIDLTAKSTETQFEDIAGTATGKNRLDKMKSLFTSDSEALKEKLRAMLKEEDIKIKKEEAAKAAREGKKAAEEKAKASAEDSERSKAERLEIESEATIEDATGKVVLRDDNPPVFTPPKSVFKRYQINF